jgi:1-acyl-sn-glycerol-3-phosphate acyltransferase
VNAAPAQAVDGARGARPVDLPAGASPRLHDLARWFGASCFRLFLRVRVHHADRIPGTGAVVVVANHSALVDGPLLFGLLGRRTVFLTKSELFRGPLAVLLPLIGQLAVRRGEPDPAPLRPAVAVLRGGGLVAVFPEGTRGRGDVAAAQHGAAWLARTTGAAVLPVVVRGTRRVPGIRRRFRPRWTSWSACPWWCRPAAPAPGWPPPPRPSVPRWPGWSSNSMRYAPRWNDATQWNRERREHG